MRISDVCKERRAALKLSNSAISERSGISLQTINNFFSSRSMAPSIYTVGPICRVLGVSLDEIFEIIAPGMGPEEIRRIKEQNDFSQEELLRLQKEAEHIKAETQSTIDHQAHDLKEQEAKIARLEEKIQDMKLTIDHDGDRIRYQKRAIHLLRLAITVLIAWIAGIYIFHPELTFFG